MALGTPVHFLCSPGCVHTANSWAAHTAPLLAWSTPDVPSWLEYIAALEGCACTCIPRLQVELPQCRYQSIRTFAPSGQDPCESCRSSQTRLRIRIFARIQSALYAHFTDGLFCVHYIFALHWQSWIGDVSYSQFCNSPVPRSPSQNHLDDFHPSPRPSGTSSPVSSETC